MISLRVVMEWALTCFNVKETELNMAIKNRQRSPRSSDLRNVIGGMRSNAVCNHESWRSNQTFQHIENRSYEFASFFRTYKATEFTALCMFVRAIS